MRELDFYKALTAKDLGADLNEFRDAKLEKLVAADEKATAAKAKKAEDRENLKTTIIDFLTNEDGFYSASALIEKLNLDCTPAMVSYVLREAVKAGIVTKGTAEDKKVGYAVEA